MTTLGIMMDACQRILRTENRDGVQVTMVAGITCISFVKDELVDSSAINDDNVDAYFFMTDSAGTYITHIGAGNTQPHPQGIFLP